MMRIDSIEPWIKDGQLVGCEIGYDGEFMKVKNLGEFIQWLHSAQKALEECQMMRDVVSK